MEGALMALLNDPASQPSQMWAVVRYLAFARNPVKYDRVRMLLSPPSLGDDGKTFDWAVESLEELGMVAQAENGDLSLDGMATQLHGEDFGAFANVLRTRVLAPELNTGVGNDASQVGPRDLTRALAWFLSLDPLTNSLNWSDVQRLQPRALRPEVGKAIVNDTRWPRFVTWATALGLAAADLLVNDRIVPDCTAAVKRVLQDMGKPGHVFDALEALRTLRTSLPVLPGGAFSVAVGIPDPGDTTTSRALSFALLRGEDEGWLRLDRPGADARRFLSIQDPERPDAPRACRSIAILEDGRG
jgi:hypothetical protein